MLRKISFLLCMCFLIVIVAPVAAFSAEAKTAIVNMKTAFYEYEKTKTMEKELEGVTNKLSEDRKKNGGRA